MATTNPTHLLGRVFTDISFQKTHGRRTRSKKHRRTVRQRVLRLCKDLVYPNIDFERRHNTVHAKSDLLDALVLAASHEKCTKGGCELFEENTAPARRTPASNTILYHIRNLNRNGNGRAKIKEMFDLALRNTLSVGRRAGAFKRRMDIAIDLHDQHYYGDKNDFMVVEGKYDRGTNHFFRFMTCSIVEAGRRFTVGSLSVHKLSVKEKLLGKTLDMAAKEVKIRAVYLDRGFYTMRVIQELQRRNLRFLMPAPMNKKVKRLVAKFEAPHVMKYKMGRGSNTVEYNLAIMKDKEGRKKAFATNLKIKDGPTLFKLYKKRWGIETTYRMMKHDFTPRTTSKNYVVRLFYFMLSTCLYNIWVLANMLFGRIVLGCTPEKPEISASLFNYTLLHLEDP